MCLRQIIFFSLQSEAYPEGYGAPINNAKCMFDTYRSNCLFSEELEKKLLWDVFFEMVSQPGLVVL